MLPHPRLSTCPLTLQADLLHHVAAIQVELPQPWRLPHERCQRRGAQVAAAKQVELGQAGAVQLRGIQLTQAARRE